MVRVAIAFALAATLLLGACDERGEDTETTGGDPAITLVLVGDVGLNISRAPVEADGFHVPDSDRVYSWQDLTAGIAPLITSKRRTSPLGFPSGATSRNVWPTPISCRP